MIKSIGMLSLCMAIVFVFATASFAKTKASKVNGLSRTEVQAKLKKLNSMIKKGEAMRSQMCFDCLDLLEQLEGAAQFATWACGGNGWGGWLCNWALNGATNLGNNFDNAGCTIPGNWNVITKYLNTEIPVTNKITFMTRKEAFGIG